MTAMTRGILFILATLLGSTSVRPQNQPAAPPDLAFHVVSYAESAASARERTLSEFKKYADASRKQDGFVRIEVFEQTGRPGHYALIETWRDQKTYDSRDAAAQKQLVAGLAPVRTAHYDQRPYKALTIGPPATLNRQTVYVISHVDVSMNPQVPVLLQRISAGSRMEPGNLRYDVLQHTMRANHFTVIEAWRDERALETHVSAPHTLQYREELGPFLGSPLDERIFRAIE